MFERKRCHRGVLPVALVLVMALAAAFGLASTSVADDSLPKLEDFLSEQKIELTVKDVEKGVTGTAYRYAYPDWNTTKNLPLSSKYIFEDKVAEWLETQMRGGAF